ncbi:hypothetical protein OROGR_005189 [Orobanche gracilis]
MRELKHGGMGVFVAAKNQVAAKNGSVFLLKWFNDTVIFGLLGLGHFMFHLDLISLSLAL